MRGIFLSALTFLVILAAIGMCSACNKCKKESCSCGSSNNQFLSSQPIGLSILSEPSYPRYSTDYVDEPSYLSTFHQEPCPKCGRHNRPVFAGRSSYNSGPYKCKCYRRNRLHRESGDDYCDK